MLTETATFAALPSSTPATAQTFHGSHMSKSPPKSAMPGFTVEPCATIKSALSSDLTEETFNSLPRAQVEWVQHPTSNAQLEADVPAGISSASGGRSIRANRASQDKLFDSWFF